MEISKLKSILPVKIYNELGEVISKFEINTPLRLSHFLAQAAHESSNFTHLEENLNYSADRLLVIFPKYFNANTAIEYAHKSEKIANKVYANRFGNGDEKSGDGWRFKGRGVLQTTFKANYQAFNKFIGNKVDLIKNPDLVSTTFALESGAFFWKSKNLNITADKGATLAVCTLVTKGINGGTTGLGERYALFNKFYNILK